MKQSGFFIEGQLSNGQWRKVSIAKTLGGLFATKKHLEHSLNNWRFIWCDSIDDYDWRRLPKR